MEDTTLIAGIAFPGKGRLQEPQKNHSKAIHDKGNPYRNNPLLTSLLGCTGALAWITIFSLGMFIDSSLYRSTLSSDFSWINFILAMFTFTPSNIALLCLVSSFTGGCASLLIFNTMTKELSPDEMKATKLNAQLFMTESPFSSMLRGIVVFFAFLAGVFIIGSTAISNPSQEAYTQAAGWVSLFAFLIGYDPTMFKLFINFSEKLKLNKENPVKDS